MSHCSRNKIIYLCGHRNILLRRFLHPTHAKPTSYSEIGYLFHYSILRCLLIEIYSRPLYQSSSNSAGYLSHRTYRPRSFLNGTVCSYKAMGIQNWCLIVGFWNIWSSRADEEYYSSYYSINKAVQREDYPKGKYLSLQLCLPKRSKVEWKVWLYIQSIGISGIFYLSFIIIIIL